MLIVMTIRFVWWQQAALLIYGVPLLFWGSADAGETRARATMLARFVTNGPAFVALLVFLEIVLIAATVK